MEGCLLVYARTRGQAKALALDGPWDWDSWDWCHLHCHRHPDWDLDEHPPHMIVETNEDLAEGLKPFYYELEDWWHYG